MFKQSTRINPLAALLLALTGVPIQTFAQDEPIATTDGERPGITLEVTELARTGGDTLTLKFTIMNDSGEGLHFYDNFGDPSVDEDAYHHNVGGTHVIDNAGQKKYLVLRDQDQMCVCSDDLDEVEAGSALNLWAKFPAPPADVDEVSVVVPHFVPMDDVPVGE